MPTVTLMPHDHSAATKLGPSTSRHSRESLSPGWIRACRKTRIRTVEELLQGKKFDMPPTNITLAQAQRAKEQGEQGRLS